MKKRQININYILGYGSLGLLALLAFAFLLPVIPTATTAITADSSNPITDSAKLKAETYVYSTLAVSLSESVNLDVVPKAGGSFTTGRANLTVTTNNTTGYAVFLQTGDNTSTLRPANGMIDAEIRPVVGEMNESNFEQNLDTWGYAIGQAEASLSSMNYKALPSSFDPAVITTDQLAAKDSYTLGFAASVSPNLPAGKYYNSVLVSVVANPIAVHTLSGITYMQEMSPYVCDYSDEHETKQLIDIRDGKSYWVAKLKDGNCWMVQNLALDLSTDKALTPADSDVSANWVPSSDTETEIPVKTEADYTSERSWNLGEVVSTNPTESSLCVQTLPSDLANQGYTQDGNNSVYYGYNIAEQCSDYYRDVSNMIASNNPDFATATSSVNGDTYDAHYLIGNYYTWNAATAGSGVSSNEANTGNSAAHHDPSRLVDAMESVCPRNWQLPASGRYFAGGISYPFDRAKSFANLLAAYGYPAGREGTGWNANNGYPYTTIVGEGRTRLDYSPMHFVRGGSISILTGSIRLASIDGVYWSSTAVPNTSNTTYNFDFNAGSVLPSYHSPRYLGFFVRCLAR